VMSGPCSTASRRRVSNSSSRVVMFRRPHAGRVERGE
jgi:hypothetical protein